MKGDFKITLQYLKELGACREGQREFRRVFPNGAGYQEVLDRCADEGRADLGEWLLMKVGRTDDVRTYEDDVNDSQKIIIFAGYLEFSANVCVRRIVSGCGIKAVCGIKAGWGIEAGLGIEAGCGIKAGDGIKAGLDIEAGCGIKAGLGIEAGNGYGVFAGIHIKISAWAELAIVSAKEKPENLVSGYWVGDKEET